MRWIRLDISFDDSWLYCLSAESQLAWIKLLCHVKRDGIKGSAKALGIIVAAKKWGIGEESVAKMLQAGVNDGAIVIEGGQWVIANWREYQDPDPTAAERMKRHRESQKTTIEPATVTPVTRNKGVTPVTTVTNGVTCRATETETETETLTKTGKEKAITLGDSSLVSPNARDAFFASVLDHLSHAAKKTFGHLNFDKSPRLKNLRARWKECPVSEREYFLSACKLVIDHKAAMWGNDPKMREYIRPETLFSTKFEGYYAEAQEWDANGRRNAKGEQSWEDTLQVMIGGRP